MIHTGVKDNTLFLVNAHLNVLDNYSVYTNQFRGLGFANAFSTRTLTRRVRYLCGIVGPQLLLLLFCGFID